MSKNLKHGLVLSLFVVALAIFLYNMGYLNSHSPKPGQGAVCEILHPKTGARTTTTLLEIFNMARESPAARVPNGPTTGRVGCPIT